ncbi:scavenger receptor cysteine-rich type 1 protein M130-like, partial [Scomber scombrus]
DALNPVTYDRVNVHVQEFGKEFESVDGIKGGPEVYEQDVKVFDDARRCRVW